MINDLELADQNLSAVAQKLPIKYPTYEEVLEEAGIDRV